MGFILLTIFGQPEWGRESLKDVFLVLKSVIILLTELHFTAN